MITSTPLRNACSCGPMPTPPKTAAALIGVCTARSFRSSRICAASSRVGVSTSARVVPRGLSISWCRIGSRKAAVLPLPVIAQASTSRPVERRRDRVGLDRRRPREAEFLDALQEIRMEFQGAERHEWPFDPVGRHAVPIAGSALVQCISRNGASGSPAPGTPRRRDCTRRTRRDSPRKPGDSVRGRLESAQQRHAGLVLRESRPHLEDVVGTDANAVCPRFAAIAIDDGREVRAGDARAGAAFTHRADFARRPSARGSASRLRRSAAPAHRRCSG